MIPAICIGCSAEAEFIVGGHYMCSFCLENPVFELGQHVPEFLSEDVATELFQWCLLQSYDRDTFCRSTQYFGDKPYSYSGKQHDASPLPLELRRIAEKLSLYGEFNSVLLNRYRDGEDSVYWHSDDERELDSSHSIASISLGCTRTFHIRLRKEHSQKWSLSLKHGDLFLMNPGFQQKYQHTILKESALSIRINLTFRRMK